MNGYNFTDRVRKVLQMAREEAARLHHEYVGTEHILLGLIREGEGVAAAVLTNLNVDLEEIQQKIEETVKKGKAAAAAGPDLPYTSRAKKVLELAMSEARELNHSYVGTEHLLLGLLREEKGIAAQERKEIEDAGPRSLLPRPHAARGGGVARSHDRPPEGNRARDGDPVAPQEEQSGADRGARRRQDGDRRRSRAADRERAVPRRAQGSSRPLARHGGSDRRHQIPRPVRRAAQRDR